MISDHISFHARFRPDALAIVTPSASISFSRFNSDINRAAYEIRHLREAAPESVCIRIADEYLHWLVLLALSKWGIASAPTADAESPIMISDRDEGSAARLLWLDSAAIDRILGITEHRDAFPPISPDALGRVLRSSGTTGDVKRIGLTWRQLNARVRNAAIGAGPITGPCLADAGPETTLGLTMTLACWATGNAAAMGCGNLDPTAIERVRPQLISLVPFRLRHLLDALPDNYPQWPLRLISTAGPIPIALASRIREMLTADLRHAYGTSEAGSITGANLEILENDEATAGFVLPFAEVDIVDDGGTSLPRGELGQIRVRGEEVVRQYLDPVQGASSFHAGWFYPGDLGRLTEDGLLTLEGRVDDLMNIGGEKVLPAWVEKALVGCPGVADAAAFACPDENGLDVCWLGIVRTNDYSDESLSRALEGQLVTLNMIKVLWLESMPRNALGKVDRNELRAMARAADGLPQSATT